MKKNIMLSLFIVITFLVSQAQNDIEVEIDKYHFEEMNGNAKFGHRLDLYIKNNSKDTISICRNMKLFTYKLVKDSLSFKASKEGNEVINRKAGRYQYLNEDIIVKWKAYDIYANTTHCDSITWINHFMPGNKIKLAPKRYNKVELYLPSNYINNYRIGLDSGVYKVVIRMLFSNGEKYDTSLTYRITDGLINDKLRSMRSYYENKINSNLLTHEQAYDSLSIVFKKQSKNAAYYKLLDEFIIRLSSMNYKKYNYYEYLYKIFTNETHLNFAIKNSYSIQMKAYIIKDYFSKIHYNEGKLTKSQAIELSVLYLKKLYSIDPTLCEIMLYYLDKMQYSRYLNLDLYGASDVKYLKEEYSNMLKQKKN